MTKEEILSKIEAILLEDMQTLDNIGVRLDAMQTEVNEIETRIINL